MFAPLLALALIGQSPAPPSPFIGRWEGKITYTRPIANGLPEQKLIIIEDLVIDEHLRVSGTFGYPAAEASVTRIGKDSPKISPAGEFEIVVLAIGNYPAFCHFRGTVELSSDGKKMTGLKFIIRDFGESRGNGDDQDCPASIELHRTNPAAARRPFSLGYFLPLCFYE